MPGLFEGTPQLTYSTTTANTQTPEWMQQAIFNQIVAATNTAQTPYQAYGLPTVAELSPLQQQAYQQVQTNQGSWQPAMNAAQTGMQALTTATPAYHSAQPGLTAQATMLNELQSQYGNVAGSLKPYVDQAAGMNGVTAAQPYMTDAYMKAGEAGNVVTAQGLQSAQNQYLMPGQAQTNLAAGQNYYGQAGAQSIAGAAQPYMQQAGSTTAEALSERALQAANPYLQASSQNSSQNVGSYMNPYNQNVTDEIARLGARNLSQNLLPAVSDQFVKAGQFGGSRMGEFGSRALRDTQEAVLNQQAQALQSGYGQALGASQTDLARQAQLAGTVGSISGADLSRTLQGGSQYGQLASTAGGLAGQTQQGLTALGQAQTAAGQAQQQFGLSSVQANQQAQAQDAARKLASSQQISSVGQGIGSLTQAQQQALLSSGQALSGATGQGISLAQAGSAQYGQLAATAGQMANLDVNRQMSALSQMANMAQQAQGMGYVDSAALEAAGQSQQGQNQAQLNAGLAQFREEQGYTRDQLDWLNNQIRGIAPATDRTTTTNTTGSGQSYSPSPLGQLASGLAGLRGLTS